MPRFAANLNFLFTELPLLDRFDAAAKAGFAAVESTNLYDATAGEVAARLEANGLTLALFNMPAGDAAAGERGLTALAGREGEFWAAFETALRYADATGRAAHASAGRSHAARRAARHLCRQPQAGGQGGGRGRHRGADRADQPPRHAGLLPHQDGAGARCHRRGRRAQPAAAVRPLPPPDRAGRRGHGHRGIRPHHRPLPDREPPGPRRARRRRDELRVSVQAHRRARASTAGSAASTVPARVRWKA